MRKIISTLVILFFITTNLLAQNDGGGDFLRSIGKMYVVVAVIVTIFIGIISFLIFIERRISGLEKQINEE